MGGQLSIVRTLPDAECMHGVLLRVQQASPPAEAQEQQSKQREPESAAGGSTAGQQRVDCLTIAAGVANRALLVAVACLRAVAAPAIAAVAARLLRAGFLTVAARIGPVPLVATHASPVALAGHGLGAHATVVAALRIVAAVAGVVALCCVRACPVGSIALQPR